MSSRITGGELLLAVIVTVLAGCGHKPASVGPSAAARALAAAATTRPAPPFMPSPGIAIIDGGDVCADARQVATRAFYDYRELRAEWERAGSDATKDAIEQRMLGVFTAAHERVRELASAAAGQPGAAQLAAIVTRTLSRHRELLHKWEGTPSPSEKRFVVHEMLKNLGNALKEVQAVTP